MLSISSGLMFCKLSPRSLPDSSPLPFVPRAPWSMGRPLITKRGELLAPAKADCPLSLICILEPTPAAGGEMFSPATLPSSDSITLVVLLVVSSSVSTAVAEYPNLFVSLSIPRAVTTTSLRDTMSGYKTISITERLSTATSSVR